MTKKSKERAPIIGIFCREMKEGGDPFSNEYYWQAYQDLLLALKECGAEAYFLSDNNSYRGFGRFTTAYALQQKTIIDKLDKVEDITVDLVFDRGGFIGRDVLTINPALITKIALNKIEMYEHFGDMQPRSVVGNTKKQAQKAVESIPGDKVVVKEPEGSGGKEVYIGDKQEVIRELPEKYPVLVQEFMDTSVGVPGKVDGVHDVRLGICGGEVISYYIREASEGKLHANVAQGGVMKYFDVKDVPGELLKIMQSIDSRFKEYPRYYSIDFMHTPDGWKMVELNSYLGLMPISDGVEAQRTMHKLANYLVGEARKQAALTQ